MKKTLIVLILTIFINPHLHSQYWKFRTLEIGAGIGTTQFYGDVGGYSRGKNLLGIKDFSFNHTRYNINLNGRYRILSDVSARLNFHFGYLHATDERGSNEARAFESGVVFFEPSVIGEFYFLRNLGENSYLMALGKAKSFRSILSLFDSYVFTGLGGIAYSVDPNLILEPKVTKPKGFSPVIPIGLGLSFLYSRDINIGLELGGRYVFTDNLDGYTSKFSERNDMYVFFNFTFVYKIRRS